MPSYNVRLFLKYRTICLTFFSENGLIFPHSHRRFQTAHILTVDYRSAWVLWWPVPLWMANNYHSRRYRKKSFFHFPSQCFAWHLVVVEEHIFYISCILTHFVLCVSFIKQGITLTCEIHGKFHILSRGQQTSFIYIYKKNYSFCCDVNLKQLTRGRQRLR